MPPKKQPGSPQVWTDPDDAPPLTAAMLENAEVFNGDTFVKRGRGRPPTGTARELVSFRLDRDVLSRLREAGPGWQSQVNQLLRAGLGLDQLHATAKDRAHAAPAMAMAARQSPSRSATGNGKVKSGAGAK